MILHESWKKYLGLGEESVQYGKVRIMSQIPENRGTDQGFDTARSFKRRRLNPEKNDVLPSFIALTNDDARERKAQFKPPGTYNVVVNPASFSECEEYRGTSYEGLDSFADEPTDQGSPRRAENRPLLRSESSSFSGQSDHEVHVSTLLPAFLSALCIGTQGPTLLEAEPTSLAMVLQSSWQVDEKQDAR